MRKVTFAFMIALIKGLQLLLSLSILVVLHEFGHYWAARAFKTRVEKFYLFMDPYFALFKKQIGETEWGIGWLPLGGYVKISGMIDESMDKEQMKQPAQPWEFRSKPAWQRLIIMLGGIIVNLIVGFVIYAMVLMVWGETVLPNNYAVNVNESIEKYGLQSGDKILKYNDVELEHYSDLRRVPFSEQVMSATVVRGGSEVVVEFEKELGQIMIDEGVRAPFGLQFPAEIDSIIPGSRAEAAGLMAGDKLHTIDGMVASSQIQARRALGSKKSSPLLVEVMRGEQLMTIPAMTDTAGSLGFYFVANTDQMHLFPQEKIEYALGGAISEGFAIAGRTIKDYATSLRFLATKSGASQVGSLITFGSIFDGTWNWHVFWRNTAFLSLILAFMNLLPIPALDGGHVMFLIYEMIIGKPAPDRILEIAQMVGIVFLLGLMVFALGNDIWRVFTGGFG